MDIFWSCRKGDPSSIGGYLKGTNRIVIFLLPILMGVDQVAAETGHRMEKLISLGISCALLHELTHWVGEDETRTQFFGDLWDKFISKNVLSDFLREETGANSGET